MGVLAGGRRATLGLGEGRVLAPVLHQRQDAYGNHEKPANDHQAAPTSLTTPDPLVAMMRPATMKASPPTHRWLRHAAGWAPSLLPLAVPRRSTNRHDRSASEPAQIRPLVSPQGAALATLRAALRPSVRCRSP